MCARLAARRITPEQSQRLAESMVACEEAEKQGMRTMITGREFHMHVYEASQNGFLNKQTHTLHRRLAPYRRLYKNNILALDIL